MQSARHISGLLSSCQNQPHAASIPDQLARASLSRDREEDSKNARQASESVRQGAADASCERPRCRNECSGGHCSREYHSCYARRHRLQARAAADREPAAFPRAPRRRAARRSLRRAPTRPHRPGRGRRRGRIIRFIARLKTIAKISYCACCCGGRDEGHTSLLQKAVAAVRASAWRAAWHAFQRGTWHAVAGGLPQLPGPSLAIAPAGPPPSSRTTHLGLSSLLVCPASRARLRRVDYGRVER